MSKPEDIFGPLQQKKFVNINTKCPSAGILKCKERNLSVKNVWDEKKRR